jgi:predicted DNA-binding protein (MmcQ/YjbR family)
LAARDEPAELLRAQVIDHALELPEAWEDHPWDERVVKVGKKVFLFGGADDWHEGPMLTLKLPSSQPIALSQPGVVPAGYGLGRAGWVTVALAKSRLPFEALREWVDESYRAVAPKKVSARIARAADPAEDQSSR